MLFGSRRGSRSPSVGVRRQGLRTILVVELAQESIETALSGTILVIVVAPRDATSSGAIPPGPRYGVGPLRRPPLRATVAWHSRRRSKSTVDLLRIAMPQAMGAASALVVLVAIDVLADPTKELQALLGIRGLASVGTVARDSAVRHGLKIPRTAPARSRGGSTRCTPVPPVRGSRDYRPMRTRPPLPPSPPPTPAPPPLPPVEALGVEDAPLPVLLLVSVSSPQAAPSSAMIVHPPRRISPAHGALELAPVWCVRGGRFGSRYDTEKRVTMMPLA